MRIHAVGLKGLPGHANVQNRSHFEGLLSNRSGLSALALRGLSRSNVRIFEANGDSLAVLDENSLTSRHSRVLEVGIRLGSFLHVELLLSV